MIVDDFTKLSMMADLGTRPKLFGALRHFLQHHPEARAGLTVE